MFTSNNNRLFTLILDKLNENTQSVQFSGNYMFKFNNQQLGNYNFEIISRNEDALDFTSTEFVPLVDVQSIEIPFVEANERSDWEREFYVAIEVQESVDPTTNQLVIEFSESNPRYQAVLETLDNLRSNLTFIQDDYKYTFKVKEPTKVNIFKYNGKYYQILALTFNLTSLKQGFFGNETDLYLWKAEESTPVANLADYKLDKIEFAEVVGKTSRATSNSNEEEETKTADKRTWEADVVVNFNGSIPDIYLFNEKSAQSALNQQYKLYVDTVGLNTFNGLNNSYIVDVMVTSINTILKNNQVDQLTFKLERV